MRGGEPDSPDLVSLARGNSGIRFKTGPFTVNLRSAIPGFLDVFARFYGATPLLSEDQICHFHLSVNQVGGVRRMLRPQVQFAVDGTLPFEPFPLDHAFPMYEWGLNWCIASTAHSYLLLHSAAVEKNGRCVLLPAIPGSGKSTLCAGLVSRGWRLLSDEFAIVRHQDGMILPLPRAAPLKNGSIDIIRKFAPQMALGPRYEKTRKGTVAHMVPPVESVRRQGEAARPRWIVFPRYRSGAATHLKPIPQGVAFTRLVNNSFNYPVTMEAGFRALTSMVQETDCYELPNGDLEAAVSVIEQLLAEDLA